ncbi:hypothetical protein B0J14DRAFT_676940 [Halenospora varia]|nr:hypothetical protein B0J14DRAFT_676940 [Halenospora varia]
MSHLNQPDESCPSQDMGGDVAKYQYPPPPGEEYEHTRAYHSHTSLNSSVILPSMSYDSQCLQTDGYPQELRVNPQDSYRDAQQSLSDYGRVELGSWNEFQHMLSTPSAPRQKAAIACRYCRRRKIKCSGSEEHAQGRCTNCQRFQQDCIFVPVSGHAQALVPAHLAYPHIQNMGVDSDGGVHSLFPGQQLYGAHGQPLRQIAPTTVDSLSYAAVPQTELGGGFADVIIGESRKRRHVEPHPSILPPPIPGQLHHGQDGAKRPVAEDNLLLPPTTAAAGLGVQQTPIHSPYVSSNSELPTTLPSISLHPIASVDIKSRAREIDRDMLGRLDGKKC